MNEDSPLSFHVQSVATPSEATQVPLETKEDGAGRKKKEYALAVKIIEGHEIFPFPGVDPVSYSKLKAGEEECPGFATPIDELLERFRSEGMKVVVDGPGIDDPKKRQCVHLACTKQ